MYLVICACDCEYFIKLSKMWPSRGKLMVLRALQSTFSSNSEPVNPSEENQTSESDPNLENSFDNDYCNENYNGKLISKYFIGI